MKTRGRREKKINCFLI